jgi:hypothetical protein
MIVNNKTVRLLVALLALLLVGCSIYLVIYLNSQTPIKKGLRFLTTTDKDYIGGASLLVGEGLNAVCKDKELAEFSEAKIKNQGSEEEKLIYYKITDPSYYPEDIFQINNIKDIYNRLLAKSVFCKIFAYQDILSDIDQLERDGGYNSAHILSSLTLMKGNGCYPEEPLNPLIEELTGELAKAQDEERAPCDNVDIYAERAAFIGYAGFPIKDSWIKNILNCQLPDGSWNEDPHATVLALWALAQQKGNCK